MVCVGSAPSRHHQEELAGQQQQRLSGQTRQRRHLRRPHELKVTRRRSHQLQQVTHSATCGQTTVAQPLIGSHSLVRLQRDNLVVLVSFGPQSGPITTHYLITSWPVTGLTPPTSCSQNQLLVGTWPDQLDSPGVGYRLRVPLAHQAAAEAGLDRVSALTWSDLAYDPP